MSNSTKFLCPFQTAPYKGVTAYSPVAVKSAPFEMSSLVPECVEANLKADNIFPQLRGGSRLFFDVRTREMLKHVIQVVGSIGSRMER